MLHKKTVFQSSQKMFTDRLLQDGYFSDIVIETLGHTRSCCHRAHSQVQKYIPFSLPEGQMLPKKKASILLFSVFYNPILSIVRLFSIMETPWEKKKESTGIWLLYNAVLISTVQGSESAVCIHISHPSWTSPAHLTHLDHHRALSGASSALWQLPTS